MKKHMKKFLVFWAVGSMVGLYTTLVIKILWNWFAVPALHVSELSFWGVFGLLLLVGLFRERDEQDAERRMMNIMAAVVASVPNERREEVESKIEEYAWEQLRVGIWLEAGKMVCTKLVGNSLVLGLGFVVHTFLA